nr:hypothetical protein [Tanacetum cinerariifolium]
MCINQGTITLHKYERFHSHIKEHINANVELQFMRTISPSSKILRKVMKYDLKDTRITWLRWVAVGQTYMTYT